MFGVNSGQARELERALGGMSRAAIPNAVRSTLSRLAYQARENSVSNIRAKFINRNQYTARSVAYERTTGYRVDQMSSRVGSVAPYMDEQELGGTIRKQGKHGVSIPTPYASGESSIPRQRLVRKANLKRNRTVKSIKVGRKGAQAFVILARVAIESGAQFVTSDYWSERPSVFRVVGSKRLPSGPRRPGGKRLPGGRIFRAVHTMRHASVAIKAQKWLEPASLDAAKRAPELYTEALGAQLERLKLRGAKK